MVAIVQGKKKQLLWKAITFSGTAILHAQFEFGLLFFTRKFKMSESKNNMCLLQRKKHLKQQKKNENKINL